MAKSLEAGKLIVGAIAVSVDPTGTAATALGIDTLLQIKTWASGKPNLQKLARDLDQKFHTELAKPRFDKPKDARKLLPQMLEAAKPDPDMFAACALDADEILKAMHEVLATKDDEFQTREIRTAFDNLLRPLLIKACNDPDLVEALSPHLTRTLHKKQDEQIALLEQLVRQTRNNPNLSPEARELARTERLIQRIAEKHLETTSDDPLLALEEIERTLERFAAQSQRTRQGSNLDRTVKDSLSRSDTLARDGDIPSAIYEITLAEEDIAAREQELQGAREALVRQRLILADLDGDPDAAAKCEFSLLRLGLGRDPTIGQIVDRAIELEADFKRFGNYFAGLTARALLEEAYEQAGPEDQPDIVLGQLANATLSLAERSADQALFDNAIALFRQHEAMVPRNLIPYVWATTKNNLGNALKMQGRRAEGQEGTDLLSQAVAAYRNALEVRTKGAHPVDWAGTQNNLGNALTDQGSRTEGQDGTDLLSQAVAAYRNALKVRTKKAHPLDWAMTQNNLGVALQEQGIRTKGQDGTDLLSQAVAANCSALEIYTKSAYPLDWAMTQNNLGNALQQQGRRTTGQIGTDLLSKAVAAYSSALDVFTRKAHPVNWARTKSNLGIALKNQASRTEGPDGADLLSEAAAAFRSALEVRSNDAHPVEWAMTQENIAITEAARAEHGATDDPRPHLEAALAAVAAALTVYDPVHMSYDYGTATRLRDDIQAKLDALPPG